MAKGLVLNSPPVASISGLTFCSAQALRRLAVARPIDYNTILLQPEAAARVIVRDNVENSVRGSSRPHRPPVSKA